MSFRFFLCLNRWCFMFLLDRLWVLLFSLLSIHRFEASFLPPFCYHIMIVFHFNYLQLAIGFCSYSCHTPEKIKKTRRKLKKIRLKLKLRVRVRTCFGKLTQVAEIGHIANMLYYLGFDVECVETHSHTIVNHLLNYWCSQFWLCHFLRKKSNSNCY